MAEDKLQTRGSTALARPDYIKESFAGHENISSKDIRPPALRIAQSTSPETKRSKPDRYIDGLREGELFDSLSKEIYGEGPIGIVIVNPLGHRHVEFDKDGNVLEFNVADDDPRTNWTDEIINGQKTRVKPRATKFLDFLILAVLPDGRKRVMTMSLKSTQLKKGGEILSTIAGNKLPCYAYQFAAVPVPEGKGDRSWYGWRFVQGWPDEATYYEAEKFYKTMSDKNIHVEAEESGAVADEEVGDNDIPF